MTQEKKKPSFVRHAAHRKKRLALVWRKPKGLHNKLRLNKRSRGVRVSSGYGSATSTRGLVQGKKQVVVYTKDDMAQYEPEVHALMIGRVGNKRRVELLEEAKKHGFVVLNHDVEEKVKAIKEEVSSRTLTRKEREEKRKEQEKAAQEKEQNKKEASENKKKADDSQDQEDKKAQEKKAHDKVLTKKE